MSLKRYAVASALLGAAALVAAFAVDAAAPTRIRFAVDDVFFSPRLTQACGFPVYRHDEGTVQIQLFRNRDGSEVIREIDTVPGYRITLFSPLSEGGTGGMVSSPIASPLITSYPEGVHLGAPAVLTFVGNQIGAPGMPQAGREVYAGEVFFIDEAGVPFTEPLELIDRNGHFADAADFLAARCASLVP